MKESTYFGPLSLKDSKKHLLHYFSSLLEINKIAQVVKSKHQMSCFLIPGVGKHIPKVL